MLHHILLNLSAFVVCNALFVQTARAASYQRVLLVEQLFRNFTDATVQLINLTFLSILLLSKCRQLVNHVLIWRLSEIGRQSLLVCCLGFSRATRVLRRNSLIAQVI